MGSCVSLAALLVLLPVQASAQTVADSTAIPQELASHVAGAVAAIWSVPESTVELEWGVVRNGAGVLAADAEFRLLPGTRGAFVVDFTRADGGPLAVRLRAGVRESVAVASRPLTVGTTLQDGDVTFDELTRWGPPSSAEEAIPTAGWVVRRAVSEGDVLEDPVVQAPLLVSPGSRVMLVWQRNSVSVSIEGSAINGGSLGEEVRVRLDNKRGRARGVITGQGVVRLVTRGQS